jgi:type IV pilus assembly protein PilZ
MLENRVHRRAPLRLELNYRDATNKNFLFEYSQNISKGGIFIETDTPLPLGSRLKIRFQPPGGEAELQVEGEVSWVNEVKEGDDNPNPGMGVQWVDLSDDQYQLIASIVQAILILPG